MRLATFNILHGRSADDGVVDLDRFRAAVRDLDADVLALQEVDLDQPRSQLADLTAVAAEAMGAVSSRFVAALAGTPGATWMAATGREQPGTASYGVALLARYPVRRWQVLRLARIPIHVPVYLRQPGKVIVIKEEPRAVAIAELDTPAGPLTVASTHLSFVPGWNIVQLRRLWRDLRALPGPRVLMGDLNMVPPMPSRLTGMRSLAAVHTFPHDKPIRQLDHVLSDDAALQVTAFQALRLPVSDHRALVVDVERT